MVKLGFAGELDGIAVDPQDPMPLFRQLYLGLREAILARRVVAGARLPPTRSLARSLGVARNTVMAAYEQLYAEGYLEGRVGSGTIVARDLPLDAPIALPASGIAPSGSSTGWRLTDYARTAQAFPGRHRLRGAGAFEIDRPALDAFPMETFRRLLTSCLRRDTRALLEGSDPAGSPALRQAIVEWAWTTRGIACSPAQVVVTAGGQHGVEMLVRALLPAGETGVVEDPGEYYVRTLMTAAGARVVGIPVDQDGMAVDQLETTVPAARLIHVTPSNQYPLGGTMPMSRRVALLGWAARAGALIVEDDCDSEFRYSSRPLAALKGLDAAGRVAYVGTFSRILLPTLRLGYLILPQDLVEPIVAMRALGDRHPPPIEQAVVAEFMAKGHFSAHVRRMRKLYADRQSTLIAALEPLAAWLSVQPAGAGMHVVGWLPDHADDRAIAERVDAAGVIVRPVSLYYHRRAARPGLLIGHSGVASGQLRRGVQTLRRILAETFG